MNPAGIQVTSSSLTFPTELFPIIASLVPLRFAPRTLRSLALGNRHFYDIFHPLLYSRLILRNEDDAIGVMQRIMNEPQLGLGVTELYIMSDLSGEARKGKKPFDVVAGLRMLVRRGLIPHIIALGLYLLNDWIYDEKGKPIPRGRLLANFWINLRIECPHLRTLILRDVGHSVDDPWITRPVIDEINSLSVSSCFARTQSTLFIWHSRDFLPYGWNGGVTYWKKKTI
jgi:hypothetical protein